MSDLKECAWCHRHLEPSAGQWRNGQWVCFDDFPKNARYINCIRKCDLCRGKAQQGIMVGKNFYCMGCSNSPMVIEAQKFTKHPKKKKGGQQKYEPHYGVQQKKKEKKRNKPKHHQQEVVVEVKIERWKVIITDISTGDL